jgi:hypothetical protein
MTPLQTETSLRDLWKIARGYLGDIREGMPVQDGRLRVVSVDAADIIDRDMGEFFMSADIIQFIPRPKRDREQTDFPTIAFRSSVRPDDAAIDHTDTAPCEYVAPDARET